MCCESSVRRLLAGAVFGLLGLLGSAHAALIDFESLPADSLFGSGATFSQGVSWQFTQQGDFGLAASADSFAVALPPSGNATQFYAALNDSSLSFTRSDGMADARRNLFDGDSGYRSGREERQRRTLADSL